MNFEELMEYYRPNRVTYNQIKKNVNNIVPFVGAGLSAFSYKLWEAVLKELNNFLPDKEGKEVNDLIEEHKYEDAADKIYEILGELQFYSQLREEFEEEKIDDNKLIYEAVALLPYLFSGQCMTTNFDKVIEHSYSVSGKNCNISFPDNINRLNSVLQGNTGNLLFKIHGDLYSNDKDIVFTGDSYNRHYKQDSVLVEKLTKWMQSRHLFFLGYSLEKDRTMDILQMVCEEGIHHYAMVPCSLDKIQDRKSELEQKGITAIFYPAEKHECVRVVLEKLLEETNPVQYEQLSLHINALPERYNRFQYQARKTELLGRNQELEQIKAFLKTDVPLLWWAVTGKGGAGKSRLVYEFGQQPPAGWKIHYIKRDEYEHLRTKYSTASKNTLYILDYVQAYIEEIGKWIRCLIDKDKTSRIRILLVERDDIEDGKSSWLERLKDNVGISRLNGITYSDKMLHLEKLDSSNIICIMQSYAKNIGSSLMQSDGEKLYKILLKIDKNYVRPLYAMIITDAYINGENPLQWNEEEILRYFNDREIERIDESVEAVFERKKEKNHKFYLVIYELLLMATGHEGLTLPEDAKRLCKEEWEYLTVMTTGDEEELCDKFYRAQLAVLEGKGTGRYVIPPILPDIMGEFFVWEQFSARNFERINHKNWLRKNISQIWEDEEKGFSFFLRLMIDHRNLIRNDEELLKILLFPWEKNMDLKERISKKSSYGKFLIIIVFYMEKNAALNIVKTLEQIYAEYPISNIREVLSLVYSNLTAKQDVEGRKESVRRLEELYKENPEEVRESLSQALFNLTAEQELEGIKESIRRLEELYKENPEEVREVLSTALVNLTAEQELEGIKESIRRLEELYKENPEEVRKSLSRALFNLTVEQELEGRKESVRRLEELYKENPEEVRKSLSQALCNLTAKQDVDVGKKSVRRLEELYKENPEEVKEKFAYAMTILGYSYYEVHLNKEAADYFIQAFKMGNDMAGINLAYMIRREEAEGFDKEYVITVLNKLGNDELSLVNKALYHIQMEGDKKSWKKADDCFNKLKIMDKNEIDYVISWWTACYQNSSMDKRGESDRKEGSIVLAFLMRHDLLESNQESIEQVFSYYPDAPEWLRLKHK